MDSQEKKFQSLIADAQKVLIVQADNPDGDSLGSSIALEQILTEFGKQVYMYCSVSTPAHLKHLTGWSRVSNELPTSFDLSIIVDTSTITLLEKMDSKTMAILRTKPTIVLDHHQVDSSIDFATLIINRPVVATGELIYELAKTLKLPLNAEAKDMLAVSIMYDSLGLTSDATSPSSIRVIADLVEGGVNLAELDSKRRELSRKSPELTSYKGQLLQRIENYLEDQLAIITIPWEEIEQYSPLYNPSMLVIDDMRLIEHNRLAVALKVYKDGKITAKIRANYGYPLASKLAEQFGGGGHKYASGFKTSDFAKVGDLKTQLIDTTKTLLDELREQNG